MLIAWTWRLVALTIEAAMLDSLKSVFSMRIRQS